MFITVTVVFHLRNVRTLSDPLNRLFKHFILIGFWITNEVKSLILGVAMQSPPYHTP